MRAWLARLSEVLNRMAGGQPGETICKRVALTYGVECLFCRMIGRLMGEPSHCEDQLRD